MGWRSQWATSPRTVAAMMAMPMSGNKWCIERLLPIGLSTGGVRAASWNQGVAEKKFSGAVAGPGGVVQALERSGAVAELFYRRAHAVEHGDEEVAEGGV